ncbi:MAG TPA: phosphate ABC transporter permease PstC [Burkholderiales bacterium]|nr:phosphate ABC transporter permease PstC [Betaproteobacteria bacterium]HQR52351.1 phosphate ABC transporter permease PstC [Burkholderiales bacterium]
MGTTHGVASSPVKPVARVVNKGTGDIVFKWLTRSVAAFTFIVLAAIIVSLVAASWPTIQKFGASFLWSTDWDPPAQQFGALVSIWGTIATSIIALFIAVPLSFGIAMFLTELSPKWLKRPLGTMIELLAAVPSIVYGMWGLLVFAPVFAQYVQPGIAATLGNVPLAGALFSGPPLGIGLLSAGIILAFMIIPFIAAVMRDVFDTTPAMLKESAYGVGATTWEVVWNVVLPYTKGGVIGGVMLGLGRALGETMAVTFVIGNTNAFQGFSLMYPGNSITSLLANEFAEATPGLHTSALMELGLILFVITFFVLAGAKVMLARMGKAEGKK